MDNKDPKKILIADNDSTVAGIYKDRLELMGFEVLLAGDGEDAVNLAKSELPDLVLLELTLPKKSGFDVLRELREDDTLKETPIFIVSGDGEDGDIRKTLEMGASLFFTKSESRLIDIIQNIEGVLLDK